MGFEGVKVVDRAASEDQNPRTGEKIHILRSKTVKFSPGRVLKQRIQ
jgi:nucleoid DNA-binding protein